MRAITYFSTDSQQEQASHCAWVNAVKLGTAMGHLYIYTL